MSPSVKRLPKHLQRYVVEQDYSKYTPQEHATWRYIMRQNRAFYAQHAVPVYLEGLKKTGIPIDRIPNISEMDECLAEFDYGAVGICGFIPPAIFLEFQALGIMPIATDMRTISHIGYTPAPDIVHEAAGHAPIVADPAYRRYLSKYGGIAHKAIFSTEDVRMYEAIRYLSDIKENPDTKPDEIRRAQERLDAAGAAMTFVSESAKVGRMGWWTIEYGLVGTPDNPKIYGAGLLSSVGEGQSCLSPKVRKVPLSLACVEQSYDITEPQPQLFIAPTLDDLPGPLAELEATMAYRRGGAFGCSVAQKAGTVNTIQLDSGVQCGGVLERFIADGETIHFFKLIGPSQLGFESQQLPGQGREHHPHGFSSPVGRWQSNPSRLPQSFSESELHAMGLERGRKCTLKFVSGFAVSGTIKTFSRAPDQTLLLIIWTDCTVTRGDEVFYQPEWGPFDMVVGATVSSVFSGPPDRDAYGDYDIGVASSSPGRQSPFSDKEKQIFSLYEKLRELRTSPAHGGLAPKLGELAFHVTKHHPSEWLLALEIVEIANAKWSGNSTWEHQSWYQQLIESLGDQRWEPTVSKLIQKGLELRSIVD
jgi:phenylalanine-4-hydroxylase